MNDWNAFDIKHLPEISYEIKEQRKRFGEDLEKIWNYKHNNQKLEKKFETAIPTKRRKSSYAVRPKALGQADACSYSLEGTA